MNARRRPAGNASLESGGIFVLRLYACFLLVAQPITRRVFGGMLGSQAPLDAYFVLTVPFALFFIAFTWLPWFHRRLGSAFLPVALIGITAQAIGEKFINLGWFMPLGTRDVVALGLMVRVWFIFQLVLFFIAWQYGARRVMWVGIGLSLVDGLSTLPFVNAASPLYGLFATILAVRLITTTGMGLGIAWVIDRQREQQQQLAEANRKLELAATTVEQLAVSHERNRMARELHDTLAHSLSAVSVQLEAVSALWDEDPATARTMLEKSLASTRTGLTEARRALHALRATPLQDLGVPLAITSLAESVAARANIKLELAIAPPLDGLPPQVEQCVYRIAQEALENVVRHSHATRVWVALKQTDGHLTLTVEDDGTGFDSADVTGAHFGVKGMRERAEMVGGQLTVQSSVNRGTCIQLDWEGGR